MGTPAEERGGGKQVLIERGAFKDIEFAMMVHPANTANGKMKIIYSIPTLTRCDGNI